MEEKVFYRIEEDNGRGAYYNDRWKRFNDHGDDKHPVVWFQFETFKKFNKEVIKENTRVLFGFESIESLKEWFCEEERISMMLEGFNIVKIKSSLYEIFEQQCIFANFERIEKIDWE